MLPLLALFAAHSVAASSPVVLIAPHLSWRLNGVLVSWMYGAKPESQPEIEFYRGHELIAKTPAMGGGVDYFATLPETCGWGKDFSYFVPGAMTAPQGVADFPCADSRETLRLAFVTDTQERPEESGLIADAMTLYAPNAVLHGGDHVQEGGYFHEWVDYFRAMLPLYRESVLVPAVGNHEYHKSPGADLYRRLFHLIPYREYFSVRIGPVTIYVLNTNFASKAALNDGLREPLPGEEDLLEDELSWFKEELSKPATPWRIALFHHAPFSRGSMNLPIALNREFELIDQLFVPLFEKGHVQLVLDGHVHLYERLKKNGVTYINGGPAGGDMDVLMPYLGQIPGIAKYTRKAGDVWKPHWMVPESQFVLPFTRTWSAIEVRSDNIKIETRDILGTVVDRADVQR